MSNNTSSTSCVSNKLDFVQSKCDNKSSCVISLSFNLFTDPCVGTFKYLDVYYDCLNSSVTSKLNLFFLLLSDK